MKNIKFYNIFACYLFCVMSFYGCATRQNFDKVEVAPNEMARFLSDKPEAFHSDFQQLLEEGERNEVLNRLQIGRKAYRDGHKELAKKQLDLALESIGAVYNDTEGARQARSLWYEEGAKNFLGEPYERVMAYYYRGLIFLEDRDFENARAAFKSGILQDAFSEEQQYRCDFALLMLLSGWASLANGEQELANVVLEEYKKFRPDFDLNKLTSASVLLITETGKAPRKLADGPGHSELKFGRGKNFSEQKVSVSIDGGEAMRLYPVEDIYFQASSRGGRPFDKILEGKAVFRQTNEKIGSTLSDIASTTMVVAPLFEGATSELQGAAGAIGLLGVAQMAAAQNARPHADTRYWNNLPDTVHVLPLSDLHGSHRLTFSFLDATEKMVLSKDIEVDFSSNNPKNIVWISSQ